MIPRYCRRQMAELWSDEHKFRLWLDIELCLCDACAQHGLIESAVAERIRRNARFDVARIRMLEEEVKHDVLAFLGSVGESLGADSRFLHRGVTSSDIVDTAFHLQLREAGKMIIESAEQLCEILKAHALRYKKTLCMGRSHGIWAEPMSFGLKMAYAYLEFQRGLERMRLACDDISVCAFSGPVGTYTHLGPDIETTVAQQLGLRSERLSTQIIPRDRHAFFFAMLGILAASLERLAVEIRHLQRSEVAEVQEPFAKGQRGSSAMPHKRNPILSENVSGLGRLVRSYVAAALDNVVLWHERDISHSSVERVMAPDATSLLDFGLQRMKTIIEGLTIDADAMRQTVKKADGIHASGRILVKLMDEGLSRDDAYALVQNCSFSFYEKGGSFLETLWENKTVRQYITRQELETMLAPETALAQIDVIYKRVFKE